MLHNITAVFLGQHAASFSQVFVMTYVQLIEMYHFLFP